MNRVGYHCSHEQHAPSTLLAHARAAEEIGFAHAMCSDHLMPWSTTAGQGHAGFAWSWLGAAMQATDMTFGTVTAPGQRYHPAILAQAIGTLAELAPDRFWVAVGTGEALNEHVTGDPWPAKPARRERLRECVDIMRALLRGETVTHQSAHVRVRDATLYTRPASGPPPFVGAALTADTARWCGSWADALITVSGASQGEIVDAFRTAAGARKPGYLQVALAYAPTDAEAEQIARSWAYAAAGDSDMKADLERPEQFDAAAAKVSRADLRKAIRIATSPQQIVDAIGRDLESGVDRVYVHHVSPHTRDQERFLADVAPALLRL